MVAPPSSEQLPPSSADDLPTLELGSGLWGSADRSLALPPAEAVVMLVTASWSEPGRPGPTVVRELCRRQGDALIGLVVAVDGRTATDGDPADTTAGAYPDDERRLPPLSVQRGRVQRALPADPDQTAMPLLLHGEPLTVERVLDQLAVAVVPTWFRWVPSEGSRSGRSSEPQGMQAWTLAGRLEGAHPKHEIQSWLALG